MIITKEKLREISNEDLYEKMLPIAQKVINSYKYLNLTEQEYKKLIFSLINISKNNYDESESYEEFFKKGLKILLSSKLKEPDDFLFCSNDFLLLTLLLLKSFI